MPPLVERELWWLRVASGDLASARAVLEAPTAPPRVAAYLAHQAAEKALKAAIAADGNEPPWSHDLIGLRARTSEAVRAGIADATLRDLYRADIRGRYPGDEGDLCDAAEVDGLLGDASALRDIVASHLGTLGLDTDGLDAS